MSLFDRGVPYRGVSRRYFDVPVQDNDLDLSEGSVGVGILIRDICLSLRQVSLFETVTCDRGRLDFVDFVILFDLKINRFQIFCGSMIILVSLTHLTNRY